MRWTSLRRVTMFAAIIVRVVRTYTDNVAPPGQIPLSMYAIQKLDDNHQRLFQQNGSQRDDEKDKIINNVYIQVFLDTVNRSAAGSNGRNNDGSVGGRNLLNGRIDPPLGSQQNPIAFKIDLEKGIVSEIDSSKSLPHTTTDKGTAVDKKLIEKSQNTSIQTQNPHEISDSVLLGDSSTPGTQKQRPEVVGLESFALSDGEATSQAMPQTTAEPFSANLRKGSITGSVKAYGTIDEGQQLPKELEKALSEEIEPLNQSRQNSGALAVADKSSFDTDIDKAIDEAAVEEQEEVEIPSPAATFIPILNTVNNFRSGKLASSHIVDYSRFSTKTPPAEATSSVPEFGHISGFSEQTLTAATISTFDEEIPLEQSQRHFDQATTTSVQAVGSLSPAGQTSLVAIGFQTVDGSESVAISDSILPFEPLISTTYPSSATITPQLVVFTNKTPRYRASTEVASQRITLATVNADSTSASLLKNNEKLPEISPEDQALYFALANAGDTIAVGDREILDDQMHLLEASTRFPTPRLAVGERIGGMQESNPPDSSAESEFRIRSSDKTSWITNRREPEIDTEKSTIPSLTVETQTTEAPESNESLSLEFSQRDAALASPDYERSHTFSRETIFNLAEDLATSTPNYLQSINHAVTAISKTDTSVDNSGRQPDRSSLTGPESIHWISTHQPDFTQDAGLKLPNPSQNPSVFEILSDETMSPKSNTDSEIDSISNSTVPLVEPLVTSQIVSSSSQLTNKVDVIAGATEIPPSESIRIGDKSRMKENLEMRDDGEDESYKHMNSLSAGNVITSPSSDSAVVESVGSSLSKEVGEELEKELNRERSGTSPSVTETATFDGIRTSTAGETSEIEPIEPSYCEAVAANGGECPVSNDKSDRTRSDVLFLIDASSSAGRQHFEQALKVIENAVQQFKNIGPDGVQVSLVQFAHEPVLEFSFRKHNCKPCLIADIADTKYMNGVSNLGNAIEKATKYGFSKRRGDRDDANNILVVISDGIIGEQLQEPLQSLRRNNVTVMVVSSRDANSELIKQLVSGDRDNLFNITSAGISPTADHLAQRVRTVGQEKSISLGKTVTMVHEESIRGFGAQCLSDGFNVTFLLLKSFGGIVAVRGKSATEGCSKVVQAEQFGENITTREINLFINFSQCSVEKTTSTNPPGKNYSVIVNVMHDKWLVTGADKGFLFQCYQTERPLEQDVNADLNVLGTFEIAETLQLSSLPPVCKYTIRKDTPHGPVIQTASLGDVIYHRWECEADHKASDVYGLHVHDCYAESDSKRKHVIIDSKGCSADANLIDDVIYADDQLLAFSHAKVFAFTVSEHLSFHCKLSLCTRKADGCEGITPPQCPRSGDADLLVYRRARHSTESFLAALTTEEEAELNFILSGNGTDSVLSLQTVDQLVNANIFWLMIMLTALSIIVAVMLIRYIYKINKSDESAVSECSQKHGIINQMDCITTAASLHSTNDFLPIEKLNREKQQAKTFSYHGLLRKIVPFGAERGVTRVEKLKTETVSVSLNSSYDDIRSQMQPEHDGLSYRSVPVTESLHVVLDPT